MTNMASLKDKYTIQGIMNTFYHKSERIKLRCLLTGSDSNEQPMA